MRPLLGAMLLLAATQGCADDPFIGTYNGTYVEAVTCDDGSGGVTDPQAGTFSIRESDRLGVHISGSGCAIPLSTEGSLCRVLPARCDTVTTDSGRISVDVLDGDGFLDGDRLTLSIEARADFIDGGFSCDIVSTYELERVGRD